jgi:AtzE family amidohydrolase
LIRRLEEAGAILVGGLNMGEYAYDFTGENIHDGPSRNPHDLQHMSGGSSGGSGAAVAAGLVPIALGSDTNGSIRVPSSFCGLFGLKPTFGRLTRSGTFPFVSSFDHLGPLARNVTDLATSYDMMQGHDPTDPFCAVQPVEPSLPSLGAGTAGLRIATAAGYFAENGLPEAFAAVETIAAALGTARTVEIPEAARARAAGFLITMAEGSALHISRLQQRPQDFDPDTRDRFLAGSLLPASWIIRAQKFRRWYRDEVLRLFNSVDLILAPATPTRAPRIGQKTFVLGGTELPVRANIGLFTQPISFIGLPVCSVPVWTKGEALPIGVQIIAAPWREDLVLRAAYALERAGIAVSPCADI